MNPPLSSLSIKELRSRAQATAPEAGRDPLLGYTIRFFSIYFTKLFLRTNITPNQMTALSMTLFCVGITLYIFPNLPLQLIGSVIIYLSVVLDGCDGELARLRGNPSGVGGVYAEPISHDIQYAYLFFPVSIGLYLSGFPAWILIAGWIATATKLLQRFFITRFDRVQEITQKDARPTSDGEGEAAHVGGTVSPLHRLYRFLNRNFFSSVGFVIPLTISALLGHIEWFVILFAAFFSLVALLYFYRQTRHIARLSRKNRSIHHV